MTWQRAADLDAVIDQALPKPSLMHRRDDGAALLYPAMLHIFAGLSESGKTWLALAACAEAVTGGRNVVYVDWETSAVAVAQRMMTLGVPRDLVVKHFHYFHGGDGNLTDDADRGLLRGHVLQLEPAVVVFDSISAGVGACGLDGNSNADASRFCTLVGDVVRDANAGARPPATLLIGHMSKDRTKDPSVIGATNWKNLVDVIVHVKLHGDPITSKTTATVSLVIDKDRWSRLRDACGDGRHWANAVFAPDVAHDADGEAVTVRLGITLRRPTPVVELDDELLVELVAHVEQNPGVTARALRMALGGNKDRVDAARRRAVAGGLVHTRTGARNATEHHPGPGPTSSEDGRET